MASYADDNKACVQFRDDYRDHAFAVVPDYDDILTSSGGALPSGSFAWFISGNYFNPDDWGHTGSSATRPSTGAWHHFLLSHDSSGTGTTKAYIDCVQAGDNADGLGGAPNHGGTPGNIYLMRTLTTTPTDLYLAGSMDEFALGSGVLTSEQIDSICEAITPPTYVGVWG